MGMTTGLLIGTKAKGKDLSLTVKVQGWVAVEKDAKWEELTAGGPQPAPGQVVALAHDGFPIDRSVEDALDQGSIQRARADPFPVPPPPPPPSLDITLSGALILEAWLKIIPQ